MHAPCFLFCSCSPAHIPNLERKLKVVNGLKTYGHAICYPSAWWSVWGELELASEVHGTALHCTCLIMISHGCQQKMHLCYHRFTHARQIIEFGFCVNGCVLQGTTKISNIKFVALAALQYDRNKKPQKWPFRVHQTHGSSKEMSDSAYGTNNVCKKFKFTGLANWYVRFIIIR